MTPQTITRKNTQHSFHTGDCISAMSAMDAGSIDLIVTSPPYNAGKQYGAHDDSQTLEEYKAFAQSWVEQCARIISETGSVWINVGYIKTGENETLPLTYLYHEIAQRYGLKLVQEIIWHFEGGMAYKNRFSHRTERWLWLSRNPSTALFDLDAVRDPKLNKRFDKRNNTLGKNPTDYWYFDRVTNRSKDKTDHPCQFPVPMIERIIKACAPSEGTVLDPFGGSGSTAVAASNTGRHSVSVDLENGFVNAAIERMSTPIVRYNIGLGWLPKLFRRLF